MILEVIRTRGPISRVELAEATGLTATTMTNVVRGLLADGLVAEAGHGESTGGKRRVLLEVDPRARFAVGIHLGIESTVMVVSNLWGAVVGRARTAGPLGYSPNRYLDRLAASLSDLVESLGMDRGLIAGVGIAVAGPFDGHQSAFASSPSFSHWTEYPLRGEFTARTGFGVVLENEAAAAAIGELWSGAIGDVESFAMIHMETEISVGIVSQGRLVRGATGIAGGLGHVSVDLKGEQCRCGNRGCLEAIAAPQAALRRYGESTGRRTNSSRLSAAMVAGDPQALHALEPSVSAFGNIAVSLTNLLELDRIVLTGAGFGNAISFFISGIQRALDERSLATGLPRVSVQASVNVRDAAAVGAAAIVLHDEVRGFSPV